MRLAGIAIIALSMLLAGCATRPVQPDTGIDWDERARSLSAETSWGARGRIAFKSGNEGGSGSLSWRQAVDGTRIVLSGPFGAGAYEIRWDDERIVVNSRNGEKVADVAGANAADRFVESQLGWSFPARSIRYWLLGVADPDFEAERRFDDAGWLTGIRQNGWDVAYSRFDVVEERYLPGKIVIENDRARVKLIVDKWLFEPRGDYGLAPSARIQ